MFLDNHEFCHAGLAASGFSAVKAFNATLLSVSEAFAAVVGVGFGAGLGLQCQNQDSWENQACAGIAATAVDAGHFSKAFVRENLGLIWRRGKAARAGFFCK